MGMFDQWGEMYPEKDEHTGEWYVVRIAYDGNLSVTPFSFKTKSSAISYIRSHGLTPSKRRK